MIFFFVDSVIINNVLTVSGVQRVIQKFHILLGVHHEKRPQPPSLYAPSPDPTHFPSG